MVLHELSWPAVCMNGEGYGSGNGKSSEDLNRLIRTLRGRFRFVVFFMDNDEPGIRIATKLTSKYEYPHIHLVGPKDISDYIVKYGTRRASSVMKRLLSKALRNEKGNFDCVHLRTAFTSANVSVPY